MGTNARRAFIKIVYNNKDISADLAPYLKSFSYNDVMSGEADDINITLEDWQGLWKADWLPEKGAMLTVSIMTQNWWQDKDSIEELPLGLFEIDEIEVSGPPEEVKIKGVSVPNQAALRGEDKSRSWEKARFSVIAKDLADGAKMELHYSADEDPTIDRAEQSQQSDLSFLMKLCGDHGMALKVADQKIIIFDEVKYEQADPVGKLTRGVDLIKSYSIKSATREVYAACQVKYQDTETKETLKHLFEVPGKTGKMLVVNEEVKSKAEADKLAKKKLREKNKNEITLSMSLAGSFYLAAGMVYEVGGFGEAFNGRYIVTKVSHDVGGGYSVSAEFRRCLDGY